MPTRALWTTLLALALGTAAVPAAAAPEATLQNCAAIEDDAARLACYDRLAAGQPAETVGPQRDAVGAGRWEVRATEDTLGRGETVSLILGADTVDSEYGLPVFLVLRCVQGRPELFVDWGVDLGNDAFVTSTFGDDRPETLVWDLAASGDSSFFPSKKIDGFVLRMLEVDRYTASAPVKGSEGEIIAQFSPVGLDIALERLREGCGWSPTVDARADEGSGSRLSAEDLDYRDQALDLFYERCGVDPEGAAGRKALADFTNLLGLGYTPKRVWQLAKKIPKSCRVQSFRDEILSRGDP